MFDFFRPKITNPKYNYLREPYTGDEVVVFDTETTGLNPKTDDILSIGAIKIKNNTLLHSEALNLMIKHDFEINSQSIKIHHLRNIDMQDGIEVEEAIYRFIDFVGNRPLVGYYLEFDVAMIDKYLKNLIGIKLPNKMIDVSSIYYHKKSFEYKDPNIDLSFAAMSRALDIPQFAKHDAINDAIMTGLMYLKLK